VEATGAVGGTVVILDPMSGEILAMASLPTFNPNQFGSYLSRAGAIEWITDGLSRARRLNPSCWLRSSRKGGGRGDEILLRKRSLPLWRHWIHDIHPQDLLTVREIVVRSSNIGTTKVAETRAARPCGSISMPLASVRRPA